MTTQDPYRRRPGHALVSLVEAGRDLVHGAAGARPGSRRRRSLGGIGQVSRWVGDGINWLLDDDGNAVTREAPWTESQSPIDGRSNGGRSERMAGDASGAEPPWLSQGEQGGEARRRPLQVIPHPAPPLLRQAESSPGQWQERPSSSEPDQSFANRDQPGSRHRGGGGGRSRPRPRSSRRIKP